MRPYLCAQVCERRIVLMHRLRVRVCVCSPSVCASTRPAGARARCAMPYRYEIRLLSALLASLLLSKEFRVPTLMVEGQHHEFPPFPVHCSYHLSTQRGSLG